DASGAAASGARGTASAPQPERYDSARPGNHLPALPAQGAGPALSQCWRVGRRLAALPGWRTDPGPSDPPVGAGPEMGPAAAGDRVAGGSGPGHHGSGLRAGRLAMAARRSGPGSGIRQGQGRGPSEPAAGTDALLQPHRPGAARTPVEELGA